MKKRIHRIFVYGTLKQGFYFHDRYLGKDQATYLGPASASTEYSLYIDGMPHMVKEATSNPVKGELYEVDEDILGSIDNLEGHPVVYKREIIETTDQNGERVLAWAYLRPLHFKGKNHAWKEDEFV